MSFDLSTAKPVEGGFDLSTATGSDGPAQPVAQAPQSFLDRVRANARANYDPSRQFGKPAMHLLDKTAYNAGAAVTDAGASIGLPAEVAAGAGYLTNLGVQTVPMLFGGESAKIAAPSLQSHAVSLMQSALKPTLKQLKSGDAATAIQTMLDQGINATKGGVEKIKGMIDDLNTQIQTSIANSTATVDKGTVANYLQGKLDAVKKQVNPEADIAAVKKAWDEFINHPLLAKITDIPVQLAQEMKQGTYRSLKDKYGQMGSADVEAQKTLARGLKEEIATAVPAVGPANAELSNLITTLNVAERRALMDLNKNPGGLAWLSHNPATWAAFMADKSALFKSLAARMLNAGSEQIPATSARLTIGGGEILNNQTPPSGILSIR